MRVDLANAAAAVFAVVAGGAMTLVLGRTHSASPAPHLEPHPSKAIGRLAEVRDARGRSVPSADYRRIVSLHPVADHLLLRLVEPERLIAITSATGTAHPESWRFGTRPQMVRGELIEATLSLSPGLVIASSLTDESLIQRLRDAGIQVFDLGDMRGIRTTIENIRTLGQLLRLEERAQSLLARYIRDIRSLEAAAPEATQRPGMYLSVFGDSLFGGTTGTSFADVLRLGGIHDIAAEAGFALWPQYSAEELVALRPRYIVTQEGMARVIRAHAVLGELPAAKDPRGIVEIPAAYNSDAGLGLIEAARIVQSKLPILLLGAKEAPPSDDRHH